MNKENKRGLWERKNHPLLDYLLKTYKIKNDAQLSKALNVLPPVISKIRNRKYPVSAVMILEIHEQFEMPVKQIKALAAESEET
jgi:hypothetical protein